MTRMLDCPRHCGSELEAERAGTTWTFAACECGADWTPAETAVMLDTMERQDEAAWESQQGSMSGPTWLEQQVTAMRLK